MLLEVFPSPFGREEELELELSLFQSEPEEVCELPPDSFPLELLLAEEFPPELLEDSDELGLLGYNWGCCWILLAVPAQAEAPDWGWNFRYPLEDGGDSSFSTVHSKNG